MRDVRLDKLLRVALALVFVTSVAGCSKDEACEIYQACCASLKSDQKIWVALQQKTRCYQYEQATGRKVCLTEIGRVLGELGHARIPVPASCQLK